MEEESIRSPQKVDLISEEEVEESLAWMNGKRATEIAVEMARLRKDVVLGRKDPLTGLKNRLGLQESIGYLMPLAIREKKELFITVLDLDNLKRVNDSSGHKGGDKLIVATAEAIKASVRSADIVARIGGDEFAIVSLVKTVEEAGIIKERLEKKLESLQISMGSSIWLTGQTFDEALALADEEMYKNKRERKKGYG